ncbi:MAG: 2-succinyl-5-enolpyruvyl-6-hydroxy-3-cyclohexene-1-carboxylic-acid synthase [Promicromonosporaceae bacterium]|nr:2-succinyl-5-enolpyruvyl-6-hydroxy-3-cyclohexene-1-carboxylic-acid synthase [Promicromonosporaceae bacterium]
MSQPPAIAAAQALVAALAEHGVRDVVLCPGSRSAPLAYALAEADAAGSIRLHVRVDERSAGFLALGLTKGANRWAPDWLAYDAPHPDASRSDTIRVRGSLPRPVAVVTTSGTAVANLHPAALEAHHSGLPLVLITADRPHELRGTGANQTTDQVGIFGGAMRFVADVPAPGGREGELRDLVITVTRALTAACGVRDRHSGPAHLNLAFREPLHPTPPVNLRKVAEPRSDTQSHPAHDSFCSTQGVTGGVPCVALVAAEPNPIGVFAAKTSERVAIPRVVPAGSTVNAGAAPALRGNLAHTLVVAGDGAGSQARRLAEAQGWPLLAEPSAEDCSGTNAIQGYRLLLDLPELTCEVENVVVFGRPTLSRSVQQLLARPDVTVTVVAPGGGPWPDAARNAALVIEQIGRTWFTPPTAAAPSPFLTRWLAASRAAAAALRQATFGEVGSLRRDRSLELPISTQTTDLNENGGLVVARAVAAATRVQDVLVVGASNPIRDLDLVLGLDDADGYCRPLIFANRGLAGIDGTVSTAMGVALAVDAATAARLNRNDEANGFSHTHSRLKAESAPGHPRVRALMGDLTFLHDAGGLLCGPLEPKANLQIIVVNDDGGSIFATLEHAEVAAAAEAAQTTFERVFATPHGTKLAALCTGYGIAHRLIENLSDLQSALVEPPAGVEVIEVRVSRTNRRAEASALQAAVEVAANRAISAR